MAKPSTRRPDPKTGELPDRQVGVLLPLPLGRTYTYAVPEDMDVTPGDFVVVPLGVRQVAGVVWNSAPDEVPPEKLKSLIGPLDVPPMANVTRRFIEWVASYNMASTGAVLKMAISVPDALKPPKPVVAYAKNSESPETLKALRITASRQRVLDEVADGPPRPAVELARAVGVGSSVVKGLAKAGALVAIDLPPPTSFDPPDWRKAGPELSAEQAEVAAVLRQQVAAGGYAATVLEGVPGSGKTEVYLEAVSEALKEGKQALVLLPEIALGAQWLERFRARFGCAPAQWHSDLAGATRCKTWRAVATGEVKVVVGARSALFLPFPCLGVIIIDEEHDPSFKQDDGVFYNARDMAVVRAKLGEIPIVLVSATPSLETVRNADLARYERYNLPNRHAGAALPDVSIIDMRVEKPTAGHWLSPPMIAGLTQTFAAGEQALLFLNRRGYAPLTLCRTCGHRLQCPQCTAWLVEHRLLGKLQCHHCGHSARLPETCPSCEATESFHACGPGVERLAEEVAELFPAITCRVAASDTIYSASQAKKLVRQIEEREIDLIIGTQIVAKGYHFPFLTFVGVVDADLGLSGGDLRAAERTFQLLYQVAGRAGREQRPGRVAVQTHMSDHAVIRTLAEGDRDGFLAAEARDREQNGMPPFGRLVGVILSGADEGAVDQAARNLNRSAPRTGDVQTLGPAPAPLALLRGRHRRRFLLKAGRDVNIQAHIRAWLRATQIPRKVRLQLDIDPYSFL